MSGDLEEFGQSLNEVFRRLGLPDPVIMSKITAEWEALAGKPWAGRSRPLFVKGTTLVVEASTPSMVAFLRYGESTLVTALQERFGRGVVDSVEVLAPGKNRGE